MKIILLSLIALFATTSHASLFDFLRSHPNAARIANNTSSIQFGSKGDVGIAHTNNEQECINSVHNAIQKQKDTPDSNGLLYAATLTSRAYKSTLEGSYSQEFEGDGFFGKKLKRGLKNNSFININSYSESSIPHEVSGCSKFSEITSVTKSTFKDKTCRVITHNLSGEKYKVLFCENDTNVYTDFLDLETTLIMTYKEIK